jgi:hypothetical protein
MTYTERALQLRPVMEQAAQSLEDSVALTAVELFPQWENLVKDGTKVKNGYRFRYGDSLWRTEQPKYTFVAHQIPGAQGMESLFSMIDETHAGTLEDPIPYSRNMEIFKGKYYIQNDVVYLCTRDSGQPLYHDLSALVGSYVEVVE